MQYDIYLLSDFIFHFSVLQNQKTTLSRTNKKNGMFYGASNNETKIIRRSEVHPFPKPRSYNETATISKYYSEN